jgi:hypothetical protein
MYKYGYASPKTIKNVAGEVLTNTTKIGKDLNKQIENKLLKDLQNDSSPNSYNYFAKLLCDLLIDRVGAKILENQTIGKIITDGFEFQKELTEIFPCMDSSCYIIKTPIFLSDKLMNIIQTKLNKKYLELNGYYFQ